MTTLHDTIADMSYDHKSIEKKWQQKWEQDRAHEVTEDAGKQKEKMYVLDMFPYPSAQGLHVGHPEGYTATDIVSRYFRMRGKHVLHPMGWDAFGLPAENYAIKTKVHPHELTQKNIATFKRQIQSLGFSYDWSREVDTSSPAYYRWTQWLFLQLYKKGLAYKKKAPVNWCPSCQTVLANEQVVDGACERCHTTVEQKELEQWFFKITNYVERLLSDLEGLDWPERIKDMQRNWIGKSEGAMIRFAARNTPEPPLKVRGGEGELSIDVFTTRPDTLFGATYLVLAPEHSLVASLPCINRKEVDAYCTKAQKKSELERTSLEKEKTGVELKGVKAVNPATKEEIPIWIADYVIARYGTGAIMAVPAHDERDFAFAKKFSLPVREVVQPNYRGPSSVITENGPLKYTGSGIMVNSGQFDGLESEAAKWKITDAVGGKRTVQYRIRDWLVSRQRYWGAPIPIIYCDACGMVPVPEKDLPVELPTDVDFQPTGESPLARSKSFHDVVCPTCGKKARRESDTMDTFVDSSWYFLRYCDPKNEKEFADKKKVGYWLGSRLPRQSPKDGGGVDLYVGGAEHAVLHLLYSRFITKALADFGYINFQEPFLKLRNQGMILGEDGQKMSKSRGNVINPDEVVERYGADTMRLYEMFMGPFKDTKPWSTDGIKGVRRLLEKVCRLYYRDPFSVITENGSPDVKRLLHKTIKKVTEDIESFKFNTAISAMMIFVNETITVGQLSVVSCQLFLKLLAPFAPHLAEELWERLGHKTSIFKESWPKFDPKLVQDEEVELVVQVNGKVRDRFTVSASLTEEKLKQQALAREKVNAWVTDKKIERVVVVKGKLVNIVVA